MAKPKGLPKSGGRQKGTPNKDTVSLFDKCEAAGLDPFTELVKLCTLGEKEELRFQALKEVCQYLYPKRKSLELSNEDSKGFVVVVKDYPGK